MAWTYKRTVTIDETKCGTANSTNFPMLFTGTYSYLATKANGGKVENASGYDIAFFSDAALTTMLDFERVAWNATTGECQFYVNIPTLDTSANTVIYLAYGNTAISTDQQDAVNTWTALTGVWHYQETSGTNVNESKNNYDGTAGRTNVLNHTGGQVGNYGQFVRASADKVDITRVDNLQPEGNFSVGAWIKQDSTGTQRAIMVADSVVSVYEGYAFTMNPNNKIYLSLGWGTGYTEKVSNTAQTDTASWHRVWATYDGSNVNFYWDGSADGSSAHSTNPTKTNSGEISQGIFIQGGVYYHAWDGGLDEIFFVKGTALSTSWITADYNNQNSPSTFYTIQATETTAIPRYLSTKKFW